MNTAQRIIKNTVSLLTGSVIARLLGFVVIVYLARILGPGSFGKISFVMAIVTYFILIADVGQLSEKVKWQPKFDLDTGREQTITWWKKYVCV